MAPVLLYRTMPLPPELKEGALLLGIALRCAMASGPSLARAGFTGAPLEVAGALFERMLDSPHGFIFAIDEWSDVLPRIGTPDQKIHAELPDLLAELDRVLATEPAPADRAFPFVLTAGERRSFTANTILRDPTWRLRDAAGALRMSPGDAATLGVTSGDRVRLKTKRGAAEVIVEVTDTMQDGHVALPNGLGLTYPSEAGTVATGVAPNELTSIEDRDPFVGTPWHKNVPAQVERL
jgi:anaerobic selenocysteine-containing dehydrogenase